MAAPKSSSLAEGSPDSPPLSKIAEGRRQRGPVFDRTGEALALGLRAGWHQLRQELKGRGGTTDKHFGGHDLRRRTSSPNQTPVKAMSRPARHHRSARSQWRYPLTALLRVCSISPLWRHGSITAQPLPARNTGSKLLYALDEQVRPV